MPDIIKPADLGKFGLPPSTAAKLRMKGDGPPYSKLGRSVVYFAEDVLDWIRQHRVTTGGAN